MRSTGPAGRFDIRELSVGLIRRGHSFQTILNAESRGLTDQELSRRRTRLDSVSATGATTVKKLVATAVGTVMLGGVGFGQATTQTMQSVPQQSVTVTDWYKQSVYDPSNNKIGEIDDVLLSPDGKVNALIVGVGGFLGIGEKHVALPFNAIKYTTKDGKVYLTLDTTRDALEAAPGLKYDRSTTSWVPAK